MSLNPYRLQGGGGGAGSGGGRDRLAGRGRDRDRRRDHRPGRLGRAGVLSLRQAWRAFPKATEAISATLGLMISLGTLDAIWSSEKWRATVILCAVVSLIAYLVAVAQRTEPAYLVSILAISTACAVADLPPERRESALFAAFAGTVVLCIAATGAYGLLPRRSGKRLNRPSWAQAQWTVAVGVAGSIAGWLLAYLSRDIVGLGVGGIAIGVAAGAALMFLAGGLARTALSDVGVLGRGAPDVAQVTSRAQRGPFPRGRQRGRGTKRAPRGHHGQ